MRRHRGHSAHSSAEFSSSNLPTQSLSHLGTLPWECDETSAAIGDPRSFLLPLRYERNYAYPLIVWLHNDGFNEHQIKQVMPHVSLQNFVSVGIRGTRAADSVGHQFDWPQTTASISAASRRVAGAIAEASQRFSIHPNRIVLAGYQSGGTMALRLALRFPESVAGVISLGGRLPRGHRLFGDLNALRDKQMPMLWQWAVQGDHFDSSGLTEDVRTSMMTGCRLEIRQYQDDDEMNTSTLADINTWVMRSIVSEASCREATQETETSRSFSVN